MSHVTTSTVMERSTIRYGFVFFVLGFLLLCRLIAMDALPLNDSTEARYGEIARIMLETGNWVTPMQAYGEPFWAKPPLSMWLSAFSMKCLGVNAWAARLPSLCLSLGVLGLVGMLAARRRGPDFAMTAVVVLAGTPYFFLNAGTVMTDPALLFCTTLCMVACWLALSENSKPWGILFFVGLGLGLLAKGPLVGVLVMGPLLMWGMKQHAYGLLWQRLPWVFGSLLMLAIALPWYVLAEIRTPGFLQYFVIGEHFSRFLESAWQGDKYGFAHAAPYGMIWVYAVAGLLPWPIIAAVGLWRSRKTVGKNVFAPEQDGWLSYLVFFALMPLVFFTFSRNIIYPYTFPSLPAFALLFAEGIRHHAFPAMTLRRCARFAALIGGIFLLVSGLFMFKPSWVSHSQDRVIAAWRQQEPPSGRHLMYWAAHPEYSAQFYSKGKIKATRDVATLERYLSGHPLNYVVVNARELDEIPAALRMHWQKVGSADTLKNNLIIFKAIQ